MLKIIPGAQKSVAATLKYLSCGPHGVHFKNKTVPLGPMMLYGDTEMGAGPLIMLCGGVKIIPWVLKMNRCDSKISVLGPARDTF